MIGNLCKQHKNNKHDPEDKVDNHTYIQDCRREALTLWDGDFPRKKMYLLQIDEEENKAADCNGNHGKSVEAI